jgi:tripartite-type tricarboxylate transporter receptor subunit TctC
MRLPAMLPPKRSGDTMLSARSAVVAFMAVGLAGLVAPAWLHAQSATEFYGGKQLVINVGSAAGGGYDAQARLMARHIGKYIPGHPTVIVQNRPGAGGLVAANYLYNVAPKDGSVIALLQRTAITAKALIGENVHFDVSKFNWLGSLASEPGVLIVWHSAAVTTAQDLLTKPLIVGGAGTANDSELTPKVLNAVIGTKLKVVPGYQSVTAVALAMERGEVEGLVDWSWSNAKRKPYLKEKKARLLMQFGLERLDELKDLPTPFDFVKSDADKTLLSVYLAPKAVARPVAAPPDVPAERVAVLRKAFADMTRDPAVIAEAEKLGMPLDASYEDAVRHVVGVVNTATPDIIARLRSIVAEH